MKQGTIEKIQNLAVSLQLVTVEDMRKHSLPQLVTMIANKLNELMNEVHRFETDVIEMVETQNENIQYLLGEGLHLEVATVFENWMEDGTFDTLINQSALKQVNDRIDETNAQLSPIRDNCVYLDDYKTSENSYTDALKLCLAEVPIKKIKKIILPCKNIDITETINIGGDINYWNLILEGSTKGIDGRGTCFVNKTNSYSFVVDLSLPTAGEWRGIIFRDLSFRNEGTEKLNNGIKLINCQQSKFENCSFFLNNKAVTLTGDTHFTAFENCQFSSNKIGVFAPDSEDVDYKSGGSNNNSFKNCFFTDNTNPIIQNNDSSEWTIDTTDFEGHNGSIILSGGNRFYNTRLERNLTDVAWLIVNGNDNELNLNCHGVGTPSTPEWRIVVKGDRNKFSGNYGFLQMGICDLGHLNYYDLNVTSKDTPTIYLLKPNTFKFNNWNGILSNQINSIGETGINKSSTKVCHAYYPTEHTLVHCKPTDTHSRHTFAVVESLSSTPRRYFKGADIYVKNNRGDFVLNVMGAQCVIPHNNEWVTFIGVSNDTGQSRTVSIVKNNQMPGSYEYSVTQPFYSEIHPPVNYIKVVKDEMICTPNYINNQLVVNSDSVNDDVTIPNQDFTNSLTFKCKNRNLFFDSGKLKERENNYGFSVVTGTSGVVPTSTLCAKITGYGEKKYITFVMKREDTSSNFEIVEGSKVNYGCDCTGANQSGSLFNTNMSGMKLYINIIE